MTNDEIIENSLKSFRVALEKARARFNDEELDMFKKELTRELERLNKTI